LLGKRDGSVAKGSKSQDIYFIQTGRGKEKVRREEKEERTL